MWFCWSWLVVAAAAVLCFAMVAKGYAGYLLGERVDFLVCFVSNVYRDCLRGVASYSYGVLRTPYEYVFTNCLLLTDEKVMWSLYIDREAGFANALGLMLRFLDSG